MTIMLVIEFVCFFNDEGCEMFTVLIMRKSEECLKLVMMFMSLFLI